MNEQTPTEGNDLISKIKRISTIVFVFILGITMLNNPHLYEGTHTSGRHFLFKLFFKFIWSSPVGIILILLGVALTYHFITTIFKSKA